MNLSMRTFFRTSFIGWVILFIAGFFYLFTFDGFVPRLRKDRIKFGIDLVGGTYITLGVQVDKALELELADRIQFLNKTLSKEQLALPLSQVIDGNKAVLTFETYAQTKAAEELLKRDQDLASAADGQQLTIHFRDTYAAKVRDEAVKGNIEVLRTRLDGLGVGEIPIAAQGEKKISIELPNIDNPEVAKAMIGKPALLEIKLIERIGGSPEEILDAYDGELPEGMIILPGKARTLEGATRYYLVPAFTDLTGRLLKNAYAGFGGTMNSEPVVHFEFNPEGGDKFNELTRKNYNRQLAVIIDGVVISDPRINEPIGAQGIIHGNFTLESAAELASLLKSGAFVAPVTFEEERQIGPSLGQESIRQGLLSCLIGLLLLFVFSVIMYKIAGVFAIFALIFNLLLILVVLGALQATLTLPGIAGMVLTIGMAIDASILIYEKIREELAHGVTLSKSINSGFSDAMEVILDSNITTFIVGVVLYKFGAGPIQGFALTLMIGIVATLITGLFFLRSIFSFFVYTLGIQKLKI